MSEHNTRGPSKRTIQSTIDHPKEDTNIINNNIEINKEKLNSPNLNGVKKKKKNNIKLIKSLYLKIDPKFIKYPFIEKSYTTKLMLIDIENALKFNYNTPINVELVNSETYELIDNFNDIIHILNKDLIIGTSGILDISFYFKKISLDLGNKSFRLKFTVKIPDEIDKQVGSLSPDAIDPFFTEAFTIVRYCIVIDNKSVTPVWYKDEGGRDNCIIVKGELRDGNEHIVVDKDIQLLTRLGYLDSESLAADQTILKVIHHEVRIDKFGKFEARCRVEEVSKNHQKKFFVIHILPNLASNPMNAEIAPAVSPPINVKSKRNKRPSGVRNPLKTHSAAYSRDSSPSLESTDSNFAAESLTTMALSNQNQVSTATSPAHPLIDMSGAITACSEWAKTVNETLINSMEWQIVAYENIDNKQLPIFRCPSCFVYRDNLRNANRPHEADCKLNNIITNYKSNFEPQFQIISDAHSPTNVNTVHTPNPPQEELNIAPLTLLRGASGGLSYPFYPSQVLDSSTMLASRPNAILLPRVTSDRDNFFPLQTPIFNMNRQITTSSTLFGQSPTTRYSSVSGI